MRSSISLRIACISTGSSVVRPSRRPAAFWRTRASPTPSWEVEVRVSIVPASKAQIPPSASAAATIIGAFGLKSNTFARAPYVGMRSGESTEERSATLPRLSHHMGGEGRAGQEGAYRTAIGCDEVERHGDQAVGPRHDVPQDEILQNQNIG